MFSWLKHFIISIFPPPSWQGRFTRFFQCLFSLTCTCKGLNWRGLDEGTVSEVWVTLRVLKARWSTRHGRQGRAVDLIFGSVKLEGKSGHLLWRSQDGPRSGSYSLTWRVWALESQEVAGSCTRTGTGGWVSRFISVPTASLSHLHFLHPVPLNYTFWKEKAK